MTDKKKTPSRRSTKDTRARIEELLGKHTRTANDDETPREEISEEGRRRIISIRLRIRDLLTLDIDVVLAA